jgi:steroid delta-isomerase-like uncharacterized protein
VLSRPLTPIIGRLNKSKLSLRRFGAFSNDFNNVNIHCDKETVMTAENNKAIIRKWVEAWMEKDLTSLDKIFAQNYTVNGVLIGAEGVKQAVQVLHSALADISIELNEIVAEDDKVVARWAVRGLHIGDFLGVPPTRKQLELRGINIYQIVDGKIVANHEETNILEVIQHLKVDNKVTGS